MNILIVAPHPDDEAIGCGGVARLRALAKDEVIVAYLTSGENSGDPEIREREAGVCSQILDTQRLYFCRWKEGTIGSVGHLEGLENIVQRENPETVFVPHFEDAHQDHKAAAILVHQLLVRGIISSVLMYEVWTPLTKVDLVVDITSAVSEKRAAIRAYQSQMQNSFEDAILGLNHYRGIMGAPHKMYAEAFARMEV